MKRRRGVNIRNELISTHSLCAVPKEEFANRFIFFASGNIEFKSNNGFKRLFTILSVAGNEEFARGMGDKNNVIFRFR